MISFRDYLRDNRQRRTLTKLRQFQNPFPDSDYGPQNQPAASSDANNLGGAMALGMGGENEEDIRTNNLVPAEKVRDSSYEEPNGDAAVSNNGADIDPSNKEKNADAGDDAAPIKVDDTDNAETQNPDKQGLIRQVPQAHLVFKREEEDGTYRELWIYKIKREMQDDAKIRQQILAGTDIPVEKMQSEDGTQKYDLWTIGDVQMMNIVGLPN
jgi:hypothetical protein